MVFYSVDAQRVSCLNPPTVRYGRMVVHFITDEGEMISVFIPRAFEDEIKEVLRTISVVIEEQSGT